VLSGDFHIHPDSVLTSWSWNFVPLDSLKRPYNHDPVLQHRNTVNSSLGWTVVASGHSCCQRRTQVGHTRCWLKCGVQGSCSPHHDYSANLLDVATNSNVNYVHSSMCALQLLA
jgi:hypothetical protein